MKPDEFEQHLRRQALRQIPAEWRVEILSAARQPSAKDQAPQMAHDVPGQRDFLIMLRSKISNLLWPSPAAWAGLGAIWLVILGVNASTNEKSTMVARGLTR